MPRKMGRGDIYVLYGQPIEFCAVYAVGQDRAGPIRIGYSRNPPEDLMAVTWVVAWPLARRIVKRCRIILDKAKKRINAAGWFDIDAGWAKKVIATAADIEHIPVFSNQDVESCKMDRASFRFDQLMNLMDCKV